LTVAKSLTRAEAAAFGFTVAIRLVHALTQVAWAIIIKIQVAAVALLDWTYVELRLISNLVSNLLSLRHLTDEVDLSIPLLGLFLVALRLGCRTVANFYSVGKINFLLKRLIESRKLFFLFLMTILVIWLVRLLNGWMENAEVVPIETLVFCIFLLLVLLWLSRDWLAFLLN